MRARVARVLRTLPLSASVALVAVPSPSSALSVQEALLSAKPAVTLVSAEVKATVTVNCGRGPVTVTPSPFIEAGTGWFVDGRGFLVTNAHVVAGETRTTIEDASGAAHVGTIVAFDPVRDLAVLAAPSLDAPALALATAARLWLASRHVNYVNAHRDRVPEAFAADHRLEQVAVGTAGELQVHRERRVEVGARFRQHGNAGIALLRELLELKLVHVTISAAADCLLGVLALRPWRNAPPGRTGRASV